MSPERVALITGTSKGIGLFLAKRYTARGIRVIGCSRGNPEENLNDYEHYTLDVSNEQRVKEMFSSIRKLHGRLDILINNAGVASMNHVLLTPLETVERLFRTNYLGTFLFCREAARLMKRHREGRIVNFATAATPMKLEGEAVYASSKAAVVSLTQILARELAEFGITVNAVGPTPLKTDLIRSVPRDKIDAVIARQAIRRFAEFRDVANVVDFLIRPESDFVTGQVIYLGGVS